MIEWFMAESQDYLFEVWLAQHPRGFYINEREDGNIARESGEVMLHRVECPHLGRGEDGITTAYAKGASDDREELVSWAESNGLTVLSCKTCEPQRETE